MGYYPTDIGWDPEPAVRRRGVRETYNSAYKPWKMPVKQWEVRLQPTPTRQEGELVNVTAHYCFNNAGEGLIFRLYNRGEDKSTVVAAFADGSWTFYRETPQNG